MGMQASVEPVRVTTPPPQPAWFEEAVRRNYRLVFSIAYGVLGSARDAEDAAQDAFLRALRARDALAERGALEAWLGQIARNAALDLGRRRERERALVEKAAAHAFRKGEAAPPPIEPDGDGLRAAIARLSEPEALVVTLRFLEGRSATEIAARLAEPAVTVRVRLHRALKRLRGIVGEEE